MPKTKQKLVEIARSFSRKVNLGNYEVADFFCSEKREVPLEEAEKTSEELFIFCRAEVEKSVEEYKKRNEPKPVDPKKSGELWDEKKQQLADEESQLRDINAELLEMAAKKQAEEGKIPAIEQ